jgi:TATA-box binding protein (TBP) (component of TFIID and TFIIIB)
MNNEMQYIINNLDDIPNDIEIFVITMTCNINCIFHIENILEYFPLNDNTIVTIKSKLKMRNIKKKNKKLNKDRKIKKGSSENNDNFFNQITIVMNIPIDYNNKKSKYVNLKIFKNGSIQVSGLQSVSQCNITINKILNLLKGDYGYFDQNNKFIEFRYIEHDDITITNPKINMINTMFQYVSKINRSQLYLRLLELKIKGELNSNLRIKYQPDIHAPVHIKIDLGNKKPVTVFVFESGKILIMAAKNKKNIIDAYEIINKLLIENHDYIIKRNLLQIIKNDPELCELIDVNALSEIINDL